MISRANIPGPTGAITFWRWLRYMNAWHLGAWIVKHEAVAWLRYYEKEESKWLN